MRKKHEKWDYGSQVSLVLPKILLTEIVETLPKMKMVIEILVIFAVQMVQIYLHSMFYHIMNAKLYFCVCWEIVVGSSDKLIFPGPWSVIHIFFTLFTFHI